ncbi:MAG: hypothetical protein WAX07_00400 [Candidatus Altiarchaeia archaeon]
MAFKEILKGFNGESIYCCNYVSEKSLRELWENRLRDYCLGARLKLHISALPLEKESCFLETRMIKEPGNAETKRWFSTVGELLAKHHEKDLFLYKIKVSADRKRKRELNIEGIDNARRDIETSLKASEYAYMELLPQAD